MSKTEVQKISVGTLEEIKDRLEVIDQGKQIALVEFDLDGDQLLVLIPNAENIEKFKRTLAKVPDVKNSLE